MDSLTEKVRKIHSETGWGRHKVYSHLVANGENCSIATVGRRLALVRETTHAKMIVSLTDWHVPYEDKSALKAAFAFCEKYQPDVIVIHEAHDFYALSKFDKDPRRENELQEEIDVVVKYMRKLRKMCPDSRIIMLESNHLDRLRRYLWSNARALAGLRALKLESLLELQQLDVKLLPNWEHKGILFKHGDIVRKSSGYTAKGEYDKEGTSGQTGHTHRLSAHYRTQRNGKFVWVECGCLCNLTPEYITGIPDWQHGIGVVQFEPDGSQYFSQPVPIINGKIYFGNELIK